MIIEDEHELEYAKAMCVLDTLFFTRLFFKEQYNKKYIQGDHHKIICKKLDEVFDGTCKRLIINIAPRYGKTQLAVKMFIAKGLALNSKSKFIHLSYSDKLALDNSEEVKDIINLSLYKKMFPHVEIKKGTDSKEKWYTVDNGGVYAAACGGQITGFGAGTVDEENTDNELFSGAIIIDDPIKPEDAQYENKRTLINDRYDSTIVNRVNSRDTPIIIIMQRVHDEDLCGHVMENYKDFEVISLPVIKEDGTALWEHKHTLKELEELRKANEFVFDTQMMQDPRPKHGMLFPKGELRHFIPTEKMEFEATIGAIDVADEGEDFLSFPIGRLIDKDIYITDVIFESDEGVTVGLCSELINRLQPEYVRVESNNGGNFFMQLLQAEVKADTGLLPSRNTTNKLSRIRTAAGFIKKYCVFVDPKHQKEEYKKFYENLTKFTKNGKGIKHDDAPDSVEQLVRFIKSYYSHLYDTD